MLQLRDVRKKSFATLMVLLNTEKVITSYAARGSSIKQMGPTVVLPWAENANNRRILTRVQTQGINTVGVFVLRQIPCVKTYTLTLQFTRDGQILILCRISDA